LPELLIVGLAILEGEKGVKSEVKVKVLLNPRRENVLEGSSRKLL